MKNILKQMGSEIRSILLIKEFCNDHSWVQPDDEYLHVVAVCQLRDRFSAFMTKRSKIMTEAKDRISQEILVERQMFMLEWRNVSEIVNHPLSKSIIIADPSLLHLNTNIAKNVYIPKKTLQICLEKAISFEKKGSQLKEKISCIEGVTIEIDEILFLLNARVKMTQNLTEIEDGLHGWRFMPISLINYHQVSLTCDRIVDSLHGLNYDDIPLVDYLSRELLTFRDFQLPLAKRLLSQTFGPTHWSAINYVIGMKFDTCVNSIFDLVSTYGTNYDRFSESLSPIEEVATKEYSLIKSISDMWNRYKNIPMELESNSRFGITVLRSLTNYISIVDSDLLNVGVMLSTPRIEQYISTLKDLEGCLKVASSSLRYWEEMQPLMINVHSFFESEEVRSQLLVELRTFKVFVI